MKGEKYPWGDQEPDGSQCNFADKRSDRALRKLDKEYTWADMSVDDGYAACAPVGSFPPMAFGLYDMAGNVSEWVADRYDENYYGQSPSRNPKGPRSGEEAVLRGGSWAFNASYLRVAGRDRYAPSYGRNDLGFRCVSGSN